MFKKYILILYFLCFSIGLSNVSFAREMTDMDIVVLRTIDKVSAYTSTFEIPVGKTVKFGASLFIKVRACRKSSPLDKPESAAFLQIWEKNIDTHKPQWVFSGWMFASNPSISAMDHPVYDVWVIDCKNAETSKKESSTKFSDEDLSKALDSEQLKPTASSLEPATDKSKEKSLLGE